MTSQRTSVPSWVGLVLCAPLACGGSVTDRGEVGGSGSEAAGNTGGSAAGGGSAGQGQGTGGIVPPIDTRPPAPEWEPEIPLGEPGWKGSSEPLCEPYLGYLSAFDVWADDRGVYSLFGAMCNTLAPGDSCSREGGGSLQFNDGSEWRRLFQAKWLTSAQLTGFPNGPLVLSGEIDGRTGIFFYDNDELTWVHEGSDVFVADTGLAYARGAWRDGWPVLEYRGDTWAEIAMLSSVPEAFWASPQTLLVATEGKIFRRDGSTADLEEVPGAPAGTYLSIWGGPGDEFWAGNSLGQLVHYDGSNWNVIESGASSISDAPVRTMWGDGEVLYFATYAEIGRVQNGVVELIVSGSSELDPESIWGRSASEIFFTVKDMSFDEYACGGSFILWFDGAEFHRF